jgi:hypothetical protein
LTSHVISLRGASRLLQTTGTIGGSSSFIANSNSRGGGGTGSTASIDGNLVGMSRGGATITGPDSSATGNTQAGGTGTSLNQILAVTGAVVPGTSTVLGSTAIDTMGNFAGVLGAAMTGGLGGGSGTLTVMSGGSGTGPASVSSANSGSIFGGGGAIAANQFGRAGGAGLGVVTGASTATGTSAADPLAVIAGTGLATANFNNAGAAVFASPGAITATPANAVMNSLFSPNTATTTPTNTRPTLFTGGSVSTSTNAPLGFSTGGQGLGTTGSGIRFGLPFP